MKVYHGTTLSSATRIVKTGFRPIAWFTTSRDYARRRACGKARNANEPVVLACNINIKQFKGDKHRVWGNGGIYAIDRIVPPAVVKGFIEAPFESPTEKSPTLLGASPKQLIKGVSKQLSEWANELLGLKHYKGVKPNHPGVNEIARWILERFDGDFDRAPQKELLRKAYLWLPEFFKGVEIDWERRSIYRRIRDVKLKPETPEPADPREEEALECLATDQSKRRIRGLKLLAECRNADLFDWCMMFINDESTDVVVAALQTTLDCDAVYPEMIEPLAESEDKRIRAAAVAALAKHAGEDAIWWFERGLKDRESCVRLETANLLSELDPTEHRELFELARYDPNPAVRNLATKLTTGKGYHMAWR